MATSTPIQYDRIAIYVGDQEYLPDGQIRAFSIVANYNTRLNQGFSPTGLASGKTVGNKDISFSWTEYLQYSTNYTNWRDFLIGNPDTIITVIPLTLVTGVPSAPQFTISGAGCTNQTVPAPSEGEAMTRNCAFIAIDSSNL